MWSIQNDRTYNAKAAVKLDDKPINIYESESESKRIGENINSCGIKDKKIVGTINQKQSLKITKMFINPNDCSFDFSLADGRGEVYEADIRSPLVQYYQNMRQSRMESITNKYIRYDIDNDGTEEWLFERGTNVASDNFSSNNQRYDIYTVKPGEITITLIGKIPYGVLYTDTDGILYCQIEEFGRKTPFKVKMTDNIISVEKVASLPNKSTVLPYKTMEEELGWNYYDPFTLGNWEIPNVWCPHCEYGFFTSGVGNNGIDCPRCGKNYMPPNEATDVTIADIGYKYIADNYVGFWRPSNNNEQELHIKAINGSQVVFSLWYYRLHQFECSLAPIKVNRAEFTAYESYDNYITGYLTFNEDKIIVTITATNAIGIGSNTEEPYYGHGNNSVQYGTVNK